MLSLAFFTYSVQWYVWLYSEAADCNRRLFRKPTIRYPTVEPEFKSELCVVDFALAARSIPATMLVTMERSRSLPLTISSPAVLLGIRAADLHSDGQFVSEEEMASLIEAMRPHLNLFASLRHYKDVMIPSYAPHVKAQPTLFCTYLKRGFLHILAFALSGHDDSQVSGHLVDSLPLSLEYATQEDLSDRLRIVLALFTLQRQVVRICDGWNSICWPPSVLIDEHEAIVEVTGLTTPSPSADLPPPPSEPNPFDFFECIYNPEDDPAYMKGVIAKSVDRVSVWLSGLDQPVGDPLDSFCSL